MDLKECRNGEARCVEVLAVIVVLVLVLRRVPIMVGIFQVDTGCEDVQEDQVFSRHVGPIGIGE